MRTLRDWADDHWAGLGVTLSIAGAVMLAAIIAVAYNVVATRSEREHRDSAQLAPYGVEVHSPMTQG